MTINISTSQRWTDSAAISGQEDESAGWIYRPQPVAYPRQRLFCFPYAGGNALMFRRWPAWLPADVELCGIVLPGHGARVSEPARTDLLSVSQDIAGVIAHYCDVPFAFFGHSFGALLAFEVTRVLRQRGVTPPAHLLVSARQAPDHGIDEASAPAVTDDAAMLARLERLGGTPRELLADEQLMSLLLPAFKADFIALDRWRNRVEPPLRVPITALAGVEDRSVSVESMRRWSAHTTGRFNFHLLDGDHFFIHSQEQALVRLVTQAIVDNSEAG